jgi:hypothetical protein
MDARFTVRFYIEIGSAGLPGAPGAGDDRCRPAPANGTRRWPRGARRPPRFYFPRQSRPASRTRMAPDETLTAGIRPSATSRYTVALLTRSRSATSRMVRSRAVPRVRCAWIVPDAAGPCRPSRSVSDRRLPPALVVSGTSVGTGLEPTVSDTPGEPSGPRGRRFKSCLPDSSMAADLLAKARRSAAVFF